jgi:hypothetical protein
MCLACQMEDELWLAYLAQVAEQEKASATGAAEPAKPEDKPSPNSSPLSPFACEELPSE